MNWCAGIVGFIQLHPWKIVGLSGSVIFGLRFVLQWIASEKAQKSIIPFGFWEASLLGSLLLLSYFAIYKRDSVGVLQSLLPVPLYARNLYLKYREVFVGRHEEVNPTVDPVGTVGK
ncbi:MAG TPA: lipid-A-disaccharide synthase N-terminal domain-containing protein [Chthoniobacterales bacterium]